MVQGINVKYHHHEVGERGQQEIETYFSDLLTTADNIITAKYILFNFAEQKNLHITFMPKPMYQQSGNGLHLHLQLTKKGYGPYDKNFLEDKEVDKIQFLPRDLDDAIEALELDNDFLKKGDVFSDELLDQWISIKKEEIH